MQKIIISSLLLTQFSPSLQAQVITDEQAVTLPETVVTATRSDTPKDELATATTVYTRKDIERLQVRTLPDLLKGSLGLDIAQTGGYGQPTSSFLRGTNSDHVLVLMDGIKIGSATAGTTPYELIPIDQIERVEIVRGPQSSLYGSEAIGGVIQIFTRKGKHDDNKPHVTLNAGGGSYNTAQTNGTVSGQLDNNWYNLGVSELNTQGFRPLPSNTSGIVSNQGDYQNTGINARVGHRFSNQGELEAFFMHSQGTNNFSSTYAGSPDNSAFVNQVVGLTGNTDLSDNWHSTLTLGQSMDNQDYLLSNGSLNSTINTTRWNASWLNKIRINEDHQLTAGADYRLDQVDSDTVYQKNSRYDAGIFTELHSHILDNHFINASIRGDKNEAFGDYVTGNLGWRYNSTFGISPFASFGNAFKAPNFNDLYWPSAYGYSGNPNLKPEESRSFEAGIAGNQTWMQWELRAYHTNIDQLIAYSSSQPYNINKAQIEGIEAQASTDWLGFHHSLNLNLLDPINQSTGQRLQRRTDKILSYDLSRTLGVVDLGAKIIAQGSRPDIYYNPTTYTQSPVDLHGFVTVDLRAAWHVNKNWMLSAKLNNLLNEIYQTAYPYNTPDRNFFVSIHYNN